LTLLAEQATWKRFLATRVEFEDSDHSTLTRFREAAHDAKMRAVAEHLHSHYRVACLASRSHALTFLEQTLQTLAATPPAVPPASVLRLNFFNLPMMGQQHSRALSDISDTICCEATHHPSTSMSIVLLPNTSELGKGMDVNRGLAGLIMKARQNVIAKLGESVNGLTVVECVAMFDVNTMYSHERELRVDFLCIISNQVDAKGEHLNVFSRSFLVRRRGVPGLLPVMPRESFQDWTKPVLQLDHGNLDHTTERRQWLSGSGLFCGILSAVFTDMGLTSSTTCPVRDHTPYDDQLALAVMEMMSPPSQASRPKLGYSAGTWKDMPGGTLIHANLETMIAENLYKLVNMNKYTLAGFPSTGQEPRGDEHFHRAFFEDNFKICCPRANHELPIRQSYYDQLGTNAVTRTMFNNLVEEHDREFNKSGVPFKSRRTAETPLDEVEDANAITINPDSSWPSKEVLLKESRCQEVKMARNPVHIIVNEAGEVFLEAQDDTIVNRNEPLFLLSGRVKVGQAATTLMAREGQWVAWAMTAESVVHCECRPALDTPCPTGPQQLRKFLLYLESNGHVRSKLHMHQVKRREDDPGQYEVASTEQAALEIKKEDGSATASLQNIGNYTDVQLLKNGRRVMVIHQLVFDSAANKITVQCPGVFLKKSVRMKKGDFVKLVG